MERQNVILGLFNGSNVTAIERCGMGMEGDVYIVTEDGESSVVKFLSEKRVRKFPHCLENEVRALGLLRQYNINVPLVKSHSIVHNCLCYEYIVGKHIIPDEYGVCNICSYLEKLYACCVDDLSFLPRLSTHRIVAELQEITAVERVYNTILKSELSQVDFSNVDFYISHGNLHIENLLWSEKNQRLYLIDWDEVMLAPIEWDIACFFVDLSMKADTKLAYYFLFQSRSLFKFNNYVLLFFIHYTAYLCWVRVQRNPNFLGVAKNEDKLQHLNEVLKSLITL